VVKEHPYEQTLVDDNTFIRVFSKDVLVEELVWHRDHFDRRIEILEGKDWEIQVENGLPKELNVGDVIWIPAETYHRIKRGSTDLKVRIEEIK
jgi:quercetin dioxygenase-like cupin family protein